MAKYRIDAYIKDNGAENIFYTHDLDDVDDIVKEWVREQYSEVYGGDPFEIEADVLVEQDGGAAWEHVWKGTIDVHVEPQDV